MAQSIHKLKENDKEPQSTRLQKFGVHQRPLQRTPEEREFVVDSGVSMHMPGQERSELSGSIQKPDNGLSQPTGEVQTNEEATVYVIYLGSFVRVQNPYRLEKLLEDHGYSYEWTSGQNHTLSTTTGKCNETTPFEQRQKIQCDTENTYTDRCPRMVNRLFQFDFKYFSNKVNAGLYRRL